MIEYLYNIARHEKAHVNFLNYTSAENFSQPNDIRYIENKGWDDYVYKKNKDSDDFSDPTYKRISLGTLMFAEIDVLPSIKKLIK